MDMAFHSQLGLDVDCASGKSLYVRHLQAGAVEEWNRKTLGSLVFQSPSSALTGRT